MQIELPGLGTVGWYNGKNSEGEWHDEHQSGPAFGGSGAFGWFREWVTGHPRIDPDTKELILYHNTFVPPYVNYSIIQSSYGLANSKDIQTSTCMNRPVPGITSAKMMHDFGVSKNYTIIMDLPLSLDPLNLAKGKPIVSYNPQGRSRFGVFPRYEPQNIRWFDTNPCCIFHTANSWNTMTRGKPSSLETESVNMLCCRLTSAALVYTAGNLVQPHYDLPVCQQEEEQCRLYYYEFDISGNATGNSIVHQWALAAIPFEFPTLRGSVSMSAAKYIYGCSVSGTTFGVALGRAVKINALLKIDVETLISKGKHNPPMPITGCVDKRDMDIITASDDFNDPIKVFKMPKGWYTQEPRFVPRANSTSEDDGWLLAYMFDESSHLTPDGEPRTDAKSELWIIDAKNMSDVLAKIQLPQRVPYGLHGNWISEEEIEGQRPIERLRSMPEAATSNGSFVWRMWMVLRWALEGCLQ